MNIQEKALAFHAQGYNCAQSVLLACAGYTGLDEKTALAISAPFGGGMRCGEMCGAVAGGLMALGLCCPFCDAADKNAKNEIASLARVFSAEFKEQLGCLRCLDLKGAGVSCERCIACGAEIAKKLIENNK